MRSAPASIHARDGDLVIGDYARHPNDAPMEHGNDDVHSLAQRGDVI